MIYLLLPKSKLKQLILLSVIFLSFTTFSQYTTDAICEGNSIAFFNPYASGVWSSSDNSVATVDVYGNVTGVSAGTCNITIQDDNSLDYTYHTVIVNSSTALTPIIGIDSVCVDHTIQLINSTPSGTWTSANTAIATIDSYGNVTGISSGTTNISYSVCGLTVTHAITVYYANPATVTLTSAIGTNNQTLDPNYYSGGTAYYFPLDTITFQIGGGATGAYLSSNTILPEGVTGSYSNGVFTICGTPYLTAPFPISDTVFHFEVIPTGGSYCGNDGFGFTIDGSGNVVSSNENNGGTITLTPPCFNAIIGSGGTFCSTDYVYMTFPVSGTATNVIANGLPFWLSGSYSAGVYTLSGWPIQLPNDTQYSFSLTTTGGTCFQTTFNSTIEILGSPLGSPISGPTSVCENSNITLSNSNPGGTWSSSDPGIASILPNGVVTGVTPGTVIITYTTNTMCSVVETYTVTVNPTPNLQVTSQTICLNETVVLTATGGATTYSWSPPLSNSATLVDNPLITTTYTVTGTTNGCSNSAVATVTVNPLPIVVAGDDQTVCAGTTIILNGGGAETYDWNNGVSDGVSFVPSIGTTTYTLTGTDILGCVNTDEVTITVNPLTQISPILGAETICTNSSITLSNATSNGTWTSSNPTIASILQNGQVTGNMAGTVTITYGINDVCSADQTIQIQVTETPTITPITGENTICVNSTTSLYNATLGGVWSSLDPNIAFVEPTNGTVTGISAGTCPIVYTVTNGNCSATATFMVNFINCTTMLLTSSSITDHQSVCFNDPIIPIQYSVNGTATNVVVSSGAFPNGITGVYANQNFTISGTPTQTGVFSFTLTTQGSTSGLEASLSGTITIDVQPIANFSYFVNDLTVQFFSNSIDGTGYIWNLNGQTSTESNPTVTFPSYGIYTVTLFAENKCGTDSTRQIFNLVGMEELSQRDILIYPNPFTSDFTIQIENDQLTEVIIQDLAGKVVFETQVFSKLNTLNLEQLARGNYLLIVKQGEESIVKRITKME